MRLLSNRIRDWQLSQAVIDVERRKVAYLNTAPIPQNDKRLSEKIRVMILKPFYYGGQLQTPESGIILIARFDAESLKASGKAEILE